MALIVARTESTPKSAAESSACSTSCQCPQGALGDACPRYVEGTLRQLVIDYAWSAGRYHVPVVPLVEDVQPPAAEILNDGVRRRAKSAI